LNLIVLIVFHQFCFPTEKSYPRLCALSNLLAAVKLKFDVNILGAATACFHVDN